jgi:hypothetical protein
VSRSLHFHPVTYTDLAYSQLVCYSLLDLRPDVLPSSHGASFEMGNFYDMIPDDEIRQWILDQKIFWVATAPLSAQGHPNCSPKGASLVHAGSLSRESLLACL